MECPRSAAWCINFLGMQPTFTQVPPRPHVVPWGDGFTKSNTATFFPWLKYGRTQHIDRYIRKLSKKLTVPPSSLQLNHRSHLRLQLDRTDGPLTIRAEPSCPLAASTHPNRPQHHPARDSAGNDEHTRVTNLCTINSRGWFCKRKTLYELLLTLMNTSGHWFLSVTNWMRSFTLSFTCNCTTSSCLASHCSRTSKYWKWLVNWSHNDNDSALTNRSSRTVEIWRVISGGLKPPRGATLRNEDENTRV